MHSRELLDFAVTLADRLAVISSTSRRLSETYLQRYWVASRGLMDLWGRSLRQCTDQFERTDDTAPVLWARWWPLLEEVLVSEAVTRVWAAVLEASDERHGLQEYGPIGRGIFRGHLDARQRVLNLLLRGRQRGVLPAARLNRVRVNVERWTDLLLSFAGDTAGTRFYCFDCQRLGNFRCGGFESNGSGGALVRAAIEVGMRDSTRVWPNHVEQHRRAQEAILGAWGPELFRQSGPMLSNWQARLLSLTDDTEGMFRDWDEWPARRAPTGDRDPENPGALGRF